MGNGKTSVKLKYEYSFKAFFIYSFVFIVWNYDPELLGLGSETIYSVRGPYPVLGIESWLAACNQKLNPLYHLSGPSVEEFFPMN